MVYDWLEPGENVILIIYFVNQRQETLLCWITCYYNISSYLHCIDNQHQFSQSSDIYSLIKSFPSIKYFKAPISFSLLTYCTYFKLLLFIFVAYFLWAVWTPGFNFQMLFLSIQFVSQFFMELYQILSAFLLRMYICPTSQNDF